MIYYQVIFSSKIELFRHVGYLFFLEQHLAYNLAMC